MMNVIEGHPDYRMPTLKTCRRGTFVYPSRYTRDDMEHLKRTFEATGLKAYYKKTTLFVR